MKVITDYSRRLISQSKLVLFFTALLLLIIGLEFALIYLFDVDARILQSLKYIIPIAIALFLVLALMRPAKKRPRRKTKEKKK